ncbi:MAG: ABC transporter transmembrane domain-containing protein [Alphaproteobacteria bacterium]
MPHGLYGFILRYSKKEQLGLLLLALISYPFLYYSYDQPKQIVNHIKNATVHRMEKGNLDAYPAESIFGIPLDAVQYLAYLCFIFLILTFVNGGFKYYINVYKGRLGERMLRRMRYELYCRVLRFSLPHFKRVSSGEIIPMITSEVEPLGGFIGDAFVQPLFQGGLLIVPLFFILVQDPILGAAALAFYPLQIYVIPRIQRRVNQLAKRRVQTVRSLAERIGESISGTQEIHANDASARERADFSNRLGTIYQIRYDIYRLKFLAKFLNNSIDKLTPFLFYSIGGYLAFQGRVDLGALVAVIAAQKDLAAPWKELLDYYQQKEDVRIKYEQVVTQFEPPDLLDPSLVNGDPPPALRFSGDIAASNITLAESGAVKFLDGVSFTLPMTERIAIVGDGTSGKDELPLVLARLLWPNAGSVSIGGQKASALPESVTGRRMAYVGPQTYLISATVRENLYYGLKHRPLIAPERDQHEARSHARAMAEAEQSGNSTHDTHADWIDYAAAGVDGPDALTAKAVDALRLVGLDDDIYQFGLRGRIDPARRPELASLILKARQNFKSRLGDGAAAALIEPLDAARYNTNATLGENLLFGTPVDGEFAEENLANNRYLLEVLREMGLTAELFEVGRKLAETMVELFSGLPPGHEFFAQYSFIGSDDLPGFQAILTRLGKDESSLSDEERARILALSFKFIPARHRLDLLDDSLQERIVATRRRLAEGLPPKLRGAIEAFDGSAYNAASSIQDNILFGRLAYGQAQGGDRIGALVGEVVDALEMRAQILEVGLDFQVGIAGARLSSAQRQKLAIARAVLKRPEVMILNQSTAGLDAPAQAHIQSGLIQRFSGGGLIWALHRSSQAKDFDRVIVLRGGQVVEQGRFDDLNQPGHVLHELVASE